PTSAAPLARPKTAPATRLMPPRNSARAMRSASAPSTCVTRFTATKSPAQPIASASTGRIRWRAASVAPSAGPQAAAARPPASKPEADALAAEATHPSAEREGNQEDDDQRIHLVHGHPPRPAGAGGPQPDVTGGLCGRRTSGAAQRPLAGCHRLLLAPDARLLVVLTLP